MPTRAFFRCESAGKPAAVDARVAGRFATEGVAALLLSICRPLPLPLPLPLLMLCHVSFIGEILGAFAGAVCCRDFVAA